MITASEGFCDRLDCDDCSDENRRWYVFLSLEFKETMDIFDQTINCEDPNDPVTKIPLSYLIDKLENIIKLMREEKILMRFFFKNEPYQDFIKERLLEPKE